MTDAEIDAHATYTDGAIDEVYTLSQRAMTRSRSAQLTALVALALSIAAVALGLR